MRWATPLNTGDISAPDFLQRTEPPSVLFAAAMADALLANRVAIRVAQPCTKVKSKDESVYPADAAARESTVPTSATATVGCLAMNILQSACTARFDGAHARTFSPSATVAAITAVSKVDFPVPVR